MPDRPRVALTQWVFFACQNPRLGMKSKKDARYYIQTTAKFTQPFTKNSGTFQAMHVLELLYFSDKPQAGPDIREAA